MIDAGDPEAREARGASEQRLVVAMSGASGAIYGIRMLEMLREQHADIEVHLVCSRAASATIKEETSCSVAEVEALSDVVHRSSDIGAQIASGSFRTAGMVVAPCSIKTLSAIANGYASDLTSRAADVTLKEGRPLVLMVRESPLHLGHLRLMAQATEAGAVIAPPMPAFYQRPETLDDIVTHSVSRVLDRVGLPPAKNLEWGGLGRRVEASASIRA